MSREKRKTQSILLFDCDAELAESISIYLEDTYSVKKVAQQNMIIKELNQSVYNFLVIDYSCLHECLIELIDKVRFISPTTKIILMCTYLNAEMDNERVIQSKVDDCIFKPFNVDLLKHKLSRLSPFNQKVRILN
jgi:DNA-binding response OmpR family regulator